MMDMKTLIPWGRNKGTPAPRYEEDGSPFLTLHREVNRLFDDFFQGTDLPLGRLGWSGGWPLLEVADSGGEIKVTAELPGMDEKEVDVTLEDGVLTIRGEKKASSEGRHYSEVWRGRFERSLQVGPDIDPDKVSATFKNGVLSIAIAKKPEAQRAVKRIPIAVR